MASSPIDSVKNWRPEQDDRKRSVRRIKPSIRNRQEIQYHVDPYEIFLPSKKVIFDHWPPGKFCMLFVDFLLEKSFMNIIRVLNSLDPDQARQSVGLDLDPYCFQKLSAAMS